MNALVTIETLTPAVVFAPGGVESIIGKLEADVRAIDTDISTAGGRKEIASIAFKVARSKTALDDMGKELVADLKAKSGLIDAERRIIRDRLDALKDEVRKPLTDWENAEKDRVAGHEKAIAEINELTVFESEPSASEIEIQIGLLAEFAGRDWQEFSKAAQVTTDKVSGVLNLRLEVAKRRAAEQEELERLRAEQAERERLAHEQRIADAARAEAEARAAADAKAAAAIAEMERQAIERERVAAAERAERAEAASVEAVAKAERDAQAAARAAEEAMRAAAEKAARDQEDAVRIERDRIAKEQQKAASEAAAREADIAHRTTINRAALVAFTDGGIPEDVAKLAIQLIAKRAIPHVSIQY